VYVVGNNYLKIQTMAISFRHSAGFGKRIEYWIIGLMLKEGLDVYVPLVDDFGVDAIIRKDDGTIFEVQIKARSNDVIMGDAALFAAMTHEPRKNYYFVFYSERLDAIWIMSSKDFITESVQNKTGKNKGKRSIWFNGTKTNKETKVKYEYPKPKFDKYKMNNFDIFK
jgi:hypothetical protein